MHFITLVAQTAVYARGLQIWTDIKWFLNAIAVNLNYLMKKYLLPKEIINNNHSGLDSFSIASIVKAVWFAITLWIYLFYINVYINISQHYQQQ